MSRPLKKLPLGDLVATYATFDDALDASATLRANDFSSQAISIVGTDVVTVDKIRGKITPVSQFFSGLSSGILMMILVTAIFVFINPKFLVVLTSSALGSMGFVLFILAGAVINGVMRSASFAIRTRDKKAALRTIRQIQPRSFELRVTENKTIAVKILRDNNKLGQHTLPVHPPDSPSDNDGEPEFGVRLPRDEHGNIIRPSDD